MRRAVIVLLLLAAGCSTKTPSPTPTASSSSTQPTTSSTAATTASAPATTTPSGVVTFHAYNVVLDPDGEPGSDVIKVHLTKIGPADVTIGGPAVDICPIASLDAEPTSCTNGMTGRFSQASVAIKSATKVMIDQISITYTPDDHNVKVLLPLLAPKPGASVCKDNGCNPFFEFTPFSSGSFSATASWDGIATAKLSALEGGVAEHRYSKTGQPYREIAAKRGSSDQQPGRLQISGNLPATESAIALEDEGARELRNPQLALSWP